MVAITLLLTCSKFFAGAFYLLLAVIIVKQCSH